MMDFGMQNCVESPLGLNVLMRIGSRIPSITLIPGQSKEIEQYEVQR